MGQGGQIGKAQFQHLRAQGKPLAVRLRKALAHVGQKEAPGGGAGVRPVCWATSLSVMRGLYWLKGPQHLQATREGLDVILLVGRPSARPSSTSLVIALPQTAGRRCSPRAPV